MSTRRTTSATATAVGVLLALSAAGPVRSADAATSAAALHVPDKAVITIDGRGYGHGHGLSQYGAEGAARRGKTAGQIVHFYYPHASQATTHGRVKVLITADTDDNTTVLSRSGLKVRDLAKASTTALPASGPVGAATRWRLSSSPGGTTRLSYLTGAWHVWKKLAGDGEFSASGPIRLVVGSQNVTYRGTLQSRTPATGPADHRVTVDKVNLDDYVRGVIPREMPASWHPAALRAQAIAARTYATFESGNSTNPVYQLCDTSSCQVYGGKSAEFPSTNKAVAATAGRILTHGGSPAFTQFSASNGGWMADGGEPYLVAKKDPYDGWSGNLVHTWTTAVTSRSIEKAWPALGNLLSMKVDSRDGNGQWGGRVESMTLHGSRGDVTVSGDTFRFDLGLRSTWFDLAKASAGRAATSARASAPAYDDYVALGDSYTSGPVMPAQRNDPIGCARSTNNYPAFLAGYVGVRSYRDVSCAGAHLVALTDTQTPPIAGATPVPPQTAALSDATDLVTIGMGINEFKLFSSLTTRCPELAAQHPHGAPCRRSFTGSDGANAKYDEARLIQARFARSLRRVHHHAPHATVAVVGYPQLLPVTGTCPQAPFAAGDYAFLRHVVHLVNRSLRRAADRHHAVYVDTAGPSRGHDICAGDRAWINGSQDVDAVASKYHPTEKGERAMARRVFHVLTGKRAPLGGDAMPPPGSVILNTP